MAQRGKQIAEFIVRKAVTVTALCFAFYVNALSATPPVQQTPAPLQPPAITTKEKATLKGFDDLFQHERQGVLPFYQGQHRFLFFE